MTTRPRFNWSSALVWGGLAILWLAAIYWRFAAWIDTYQNLNH